LLRLVKIESPEANLKYSIINLQYSLLTPGAGNAFSQDRVDFIQYLALIGTLWESLLVDAFFAGAFHQITDFEIVFKFKRFFCHYNVFQRVKI
jgi:hypothetical protein